jgi:hypothetical protein
MSDNVEHLVLGILGVAAVTALGLLGHEGACMAVAAVVGAGCGGRALQSLSEGYTASRVPTQAPQASQNVTPE